MSEPVQLDIEQAIAAADTEIFLDGKVELRKGDCRDVLRAIPDNSIDSVVTDPPYALVSIQKRFGKADSAPVKIDNVNASNDIKAAYARASAGFMGKNWDTGETAFATEFWAEVHRVLKPGGFVVAFSGTRTYHRMACAIEDAGFEIRDMIPWHYASGFPKSLDVSKQLDKRAGVDRKEVGRAENFGATHLKDGKTTFGDYAGSWAITEPESDSAKEWSGWGTALKPATEPVCMARKPISESSVAANVLRWGTGAINIDGCRIHADDATGGTYTVKRLKPGATLNETGGNWRPEDGGVEYNGEMKPGRWPANLMHDNSDCITSMFPDSDGQQGDVLGTEKSRTGGDGTNCYGEFGRVPSEARNDSGSAARFFWSSKAAADDRLGSKHPTVKPIDLMRELVRLVTRKGGTVLDPFAGTGTTGEAAWLEGMRAILVEREPEYQADIARRMELAANPTKRAAVAKTKNKLDDPNDLPLFKGGVDEGR